MKLVVLAVDKRHTSSAPTHGMRAWCKCLVLIILALDAAPTATGGALVLTRTPSDLAAVWRPCLRMRGGGFGSFYRSSAASSFDIGAAELARLAALRSSLGDQLTSAVKQNPDFATDDRLVRMLRQ